jgi:CRISPR-associated protein Csx10
MKSLLCTITLQEPAMFSGLGGDPNSIVSQDFIPGATLRGAVIGFFRQQHHTKQNPCGDLPAQALHLFNGSIRFLNGYLVDAKQQRSLPAPYSLYRDKYGEKNDWKDFAVELPQRSEDPQSTIAQWEAVKTPYCTLRDTKIYALTPAREIAVHTARNRRYGRAVRQSELQSWGHGNEEGGAVFQQDALASKQVFQSVVLFDDETHITEVKKLLEKITHLGGEKRINYGAVKICVTEQEGWEEASFIGKKIEIDANDKKETNTKEKEIVIAVYALSDILVRDDNGQWNPSAETFLMTLFPQNVSTIKECLKKNNIRVFLRTETVGGFNRKWGLPLPRVAAIKRGSVFVLSVPEGTNMSERSIGYRVEDGYGRVAIRALGVANLQSSSFNRKSENVANTSSNGANTSRLVLEAGRETAAFMMKRLQSKQIDYAVLSKVRSLEYKRNGLSGSQISRLREVVAQELQKVGMGGQTAMGGQNLSTDSIMEFFSTLSSKSKEKWDKARIGNTKSRAWIENVCQAASADDFLGTLETRSLADMPLVSRDLTHEKLQLLDGVLAWMAKEGDK